MELFETSIDTVSLVFRQVFEKKFGSLINPGY